MFKEFLVTLHYMLVVSISADNTTIYLKTSIYGWDRHIVGNIKMSTHYDRKIWEFLGIRYAQAPTGENRFRKPIPTHLFQDGNNVSATQIKAICMQRIQRLAYLKDWVDKNKVEMSEDCLNLNIWVPEIKKYPTI